MSALDKLKSDRRGLMVVLSSPSGAGKTTLTRKLLADIPDMAMSVSATTRSPRPGEQEGIDYFFIDKTRFSEPMIWSKFLSSLQICASWNSDFAHAHRTVIA